MGPNPKVYVIGVGMTKVSIKKSIHHWLLRFLAPDFRIFLVVNYIFLLVILCSLAKRFRNSIKLYPFIFHYKSMTEGMEMKCQYF